MWAISTTGMWAISCKKKYTILRASGDRDGRLLCSLLLQSLGRRRRRGCRAKPKGVLLVRRDAGGKSSRQPRPQTERPHFSWLTHSSLLKQRPPSSRPPSLPPHSLPPHSLPPHSTPLQTDIKYKREEKRESEPIQIPLRRMEQCNKDHDCHLPPDNKVALPSKTVEEKGEWKIGGGGEGGGGGGEGKRQEKKEEKDGEESCEHQLTNTETWNPADSLTLHHLVNVKDTTRGVEPAPRRVEDAPQVGLR